MKVLEGEYIAKGEPDISYFLHSREYMDEMRRAAQDRRNGALKAFVDSMPIADSPSLINTHA